MLEELKRYNNLGDKAGIAYFISHVFNSPRTQKSSLSKLCAIQNNIRLNFDAAVAFFKYLELLEEKVGYLYPTQTARDILMTDDIDQKLCKLCLIQISKDGFLDTDAIHYNQQKELFAIERYGFSITSALFRNTLIQYNALKEDNGILLLNPKYEEVFAEYKRNTGLKKTIEQLEKELKQQKEQGEIAERFVMEFERRRISVTEKANKIKQISNIDVSAGYDILSFNDESSNDYDRCIEVKSFRDNEHFYWSENEIETAKLIGEEYYIYLVDVTQIDNKDYKPVIINNPALNILNNDGWILSPTSFLVIRT